MSNSSISNSNLSAEPSVEPLAEPSTEASPEASPEASTAASPAASPKSSAEYFSPKSKKPKILGFFRRIKGGKKKVRKAPREVDSYSVKDVDGTSPTKIDAYSSYSIKDVPGLMDKATQSQIIKKKKPFYFKFPQKIFGKTEHKEDRFIDSKIYCEYEGSMDPIDRQRRRSKKKADTPIGINLKFGSGDN